MYEDSLFDRLFTLTIPLVFIIGGISVFIGMLRGKYNAGKKAVMSEEEFRKYRKSELFFCSIASLGMVAFGFYLLYFWIFGPVRIE